MAESAAAESKPLGGGRRVPAWLLILIVAVLGITAIGNMLTGWRGRNEEPVVTLAPAQLGQLARRASLIVTGEVVALKRVGELNDPSVVATVVIDRSFKPASGAPDRVVVFDKDFVEAWSRHDKLLVFLGPPTSDARDGGAAYTVLRRGVFRHGSLDGSFTIADVERAVTRAAP